MSEPDGIDSGDAELLSVLEGQCRASARRAGEHLVCHAGCSECCCGPFPVTRLDVRRLRLGMAALCTEDGDRATAIVRRAAASRHTLRQDYPGDAASGRLAADEKVLDAFIELHSEVPCPVLDPEHGTCELYAHRPVACRTFGPPLQFDHEQSPPCRLCFTEAAPEEIEACRVRPDPDELEKALLERMGVAPGDEWETLIAYALAEEP